MTPRIYTHYDNLKVARNAPPEVIRAAYKALAQKYHPDRNSNNPDSERIMVIINTSYEVLSDPIVSVQRTHLPLKIKFAHDTVFTGAYHDPHTYPRHMATTPSRMAAKPTQQKRLLQKTQPQTYHVLQMGKQTLRQNNTHLT